MGEGTEAVGTPAAAAVGAPTKSAPAVGAGSSSPAEPEVEFAQTELPPAGIDGANPDPDYTATKRKSSFRDTLGLLVLGEKENEFSDAVSNDGNGDSEKMDYANLYVSSAGEQANAVPPPTSARDSIGNVIPEDVVYADSERSRSRSLGLGVPAGLLLATVKSSASSAPTDEHARKRRRESEDDPRSDAHAGAAAASSSSTSKKQAVADTEDPDEAMPDASEPASASAPVPAEEDMPRKSPKLGGVPVGEFETPVSDLDNSSDGGGGGSARALESGDQGMKRRKLLLEHETPHNVFAKRSSYPVFQQRDYAGNASASPPLNAASPGGAAVPQEAPLAPAPDDERDIIREEQYRGEEPTFFFAGLSKLNAARTSSSAEESASQRVGAGQAAPPPPTKSPAVAQKSSLTGMFERAANLLWSGGRKRKSSFKVPSLIGTGDPLSPELPGGADGGAASSSAPVGSSVSCVSSGSVVFPDHEHELEAAGDEKSKSKGEAEASTSGAPRPGGGTSSSPSFAPAVAAAAEQSPRPAGANNVEKHPIASGAAVLEPGTSSSSAVLADEKNLRLSEVSAQSHQSGAHLSARSLSLRDDGPAASVASKASEVSRRPSGNAAGPDPAGTSSKRARSADQEFALDTHENKLHKAEVPSEAVGDQPRDVEQDIVRASSSGTSALPADKMKHSTSSKSNAVWSAASPKNAKPPSPLFGLSEDQNSKKRPPPQAVENEAPPPANLDGTKTLQVQKPSVTDAAAPALALVPGAGSASSSASSSSSSCGPAPVLPPAPARPALSASSKQAQQNSFEPTAPARTSSNATGYKDVSFKRRKSIRDHKSRSMAGYDSTRTAADGGVQDHSTAQQPFESCDDCTALTHLDETSILQNLRLRYEKSQIYTSAAKVLLAVNPLAKSPAINDLYTTDRKKAYQEQMSSIHRGIRTVKETRPSCVPVKLAPHPYGMADAAYRQMLHDQQPQIVIISGVSGSGKTETAKITMGYLAYRSRSHEVEALEMAEKMLDCNPVLESFGNAATVRNCNSSRFGKYNALLFNVVGHLHSAEIRTFLLESSRVTNYASGERSYHVFYELLAAGGFGHGEFLSKRGIRWETSSYRIAREEDIGRGSPHCVFRRDDAANFKLLEQGLRGVKIDVSAVFEVLCGLIHLGEIDIISEEQNLASHALRLGNEENLDWAAKILGLDVSKLREVLTTKWVVIAGRDAYQVSRTQPQAIGLLHSLSKYLYRKLFDFIVAKVNASLNRWSAPPPLSEPVQHPCQTQNKAESHQQHISPQVIGILDIYGFEQLEVNSFEQLCINLANEHLQQFFVDNVLRGEQELYRNEGLKWTAVTVPDCRACVTAITDCFKTLDDACFRVGRMAQKEVTAVTFTQSVHDKFKTAEKARNHGIVKEPKRGRGVAEKDSILRSEGFVVTHFAGDITYHTSGWLEKNNSRLESELEKLVGSSSSPVVLEFCAPFGGAAAADASRASSGSSVAGSPDEPAGRSAVAAPTNFPKRPLARRGSSATLASFDSVSKKYLTDLSKLLQTLQEANLHYVRCFCPNAAQEPNLFDKSVVLNQMRESGTFQLVDIMHRGYPHRCDYKVLAKKFQSSLPEEYQQYDARTFIDLLMLAYDVPKCDYVMGISKLFLKSGKLAILQKLLAENASSEVSQDLRRYFTRKKQKRCFHAVRFCIFLKKFTRKCRQENLAHGLFVAARTFVRIARWHKRAQRRLAVADKQRQFARTVLLIAKLRSFVKKRLERIRVRERRLHILYRWSNFYVFNLRYIRRWRAEKERERKALAEQNVKFFAQVCLIKLRLRQAVKGARDRIRRRAAARNIDALARFCLIKVQFARKLRFLRLTKAEQERARKERAIETVRTFVQICKLQLKLRRLAAEARARLRRRATERSLELVAVYVRMTVVVRRALRRRMRRKQAAQRAQENWHTVFRHAVLPSIGIRWLNGKIKAFKLAKRAADAADGINLLVRHTNNVVRLRRAIARARRSLKTHHHLKTFGQHVMLCMALRRYLVNWRADRNKAKRVLAANARLKTFAQHVVLCKAMLLYVRRWKAEKQRRKSIRARAHLDTFARHAIVSIALRRYIRNRRTSKNLISEAQERQAHERAKKQQRTEHLLTSWARGCLLAVHFRSFVHARRQLGARRIFAFLDKSAETQRRRTALLSVLDAHRRKRRLGRMTLPKFDDIVCKLICLKRLIRRWKRRKDEQRKRKVRAKGLLDQFVRGVFVAIRLRRWLHVMQERLVLKQVDHHLARRENKQRLCTIVCGLVLLKRAVRQWALRKRRRKSVSVLLGKLCEAVRIIRSLKRWIRSCRASKNGNGTRNTRNAVSAAPAGGFAASSSLRIDFPEDDQAAMLQQPLFSTDLSDLSGCSIAARASGAVNNASLVLVAPPPTLASAASGTTDLVQAEAAIATASSAAGGTIANNQSAISPEDLQQLMTRMQMLEQEVQSLGGEVRRSRSSRQLARSSTQALVIAGDEGEPEKLLPSSSSRVSENVARQGSNGLMMVDAGAVDVVGGVEVDGLMHADAPVRDAALERTRTAGNIDVAMGERGLAGLEAGLEAMLKGIRGRGGPSPSGAAAGASATASSSSPAVDVEMHQGPRESLNGRQRLVAQSPSDFLHINYVEQCGAAGSPPVQGVSELHAAQNGSSAASSSLGSKATKHLHFPSSSKKSKSNSKKSSPKADSGTRSKRSSSGLLGVNFGHDSASKRIAANLVADNHQAGDTVAHSPVGPEGQHLHNYSDEAGEAEGDRDDMSAQHQHHLIVHADSSLVTGHAHGAFNFPEDLAEFEKQIQEASDDDSEDHRETEEEMNAGKIDAKLAAEKKYIKGNSFGSATLQQHMQRQKERRGAKSVPGLGRH